MKSTEQFRDFKGIWIPKSIWFSTLSPLEQHLLAEISSMSKGELGCYASNEYLSKFLGVNERYVKKLLASLKKMGLIKVVSFDGRKRYLQAVQSKIDELPERIINPDNQQKCPIEHGRGVLQNTAVVSYRTPETPSQNKVNSLKTNDLQNEKPTAIYKDIDKIRIKNEERI